MFYNNKDPNILLDDDQRKVVLNDEDYCLVVAGAGAGKTTTVAAKVKYLVDKKDIDPTQNVRSRLFLSICRDCYLEYQRYLKKNDAVDFEDMINESARILHDVKEMKQNKQ